MLSVLHISAADNAGGSGRAAYRIHNGLRVLGVRSRMLVSYRVTVDPDVGYIWQTQTLRGLDWLARRATERLSLQYLVYPSSFALVRHPWFREADVLQLYNTHGGYFSHTALALLGRYKPIVWRLSDMWPVTGHCAYSYECDRWKTGCGRCPLLHDAPALRTDRTGLLWRIKRRVYARSRITVVAPSRWIADVAAQSPLLGRFPVIRIPNGLDTTVFRPISKPAARELLALDPAEPVVLFSALETNAYRKGARFVPDVAARLAAAGVRFRMLVLGREAETWSSRLDVPVTALDATSDDRMLAIAYSAADVTLFPTLAENLPNGVLESMACGTPVVAFDVGGVCDAVRPGETGYLARVGDAAGLARGVGELLGDAQLRARQSKTCRDIVEREYAAELQAQRFLALYEEVVRGRTAREPGPAAIPAR